jgi:hypothetical protein
MKPKNRALLDLEVTRFIDYNACCRGLKKHPRWVQVTHLHLVDSGRQHSMSHLAEGCKALKTRLYALHHPCLMHLRLLSGSDPTDELVHARPAHATNTTQQSGLEQGSHAYPTNSSLLQATSSRASMAYTHTAHLIEATSRDISDNTPLGVRPFGSDIPQVSSPSPEAMLCSQARGEEEFLV